MSEEINRSLDAFLSSDVNKILLLKGQWGVGKTHFWKKYYLLNENKLEAYYPTYSYISLFGKGSLNEIKSALASNVEIINERKYKRVISSWKAKKRVLKKLAKLIFNNNFLQRYLWTNKNLLNETVYHDHLICFDDIERMAKELDISILMGYADELTQQKNCKIIFIFNEDQLDETQKKVFDQYREKVIDIELAYNPNLYQILDLVFGEMRQNYPVIEEVITDENGTGIGIKNIRVLKRIYQIVCDFIKLDACDQNLLIVNDFIKRAIFLSHCFYECSGKVPFEIIKDPSLAKQYKVVKTGDKRDQEQGRKARDGNEYIGEYDKDIYKTLMNKASKLRINKTSVFNQEIINKLERGIWSEEALNDFLLLESSRIDDLEKREAIYNQVNDARMLYRSNFNDNLDEIIALFERVLNDQSNYEYWDYGHFISTLDAYYSFRRIEDEEPEIDFDYIDDYIAINSEKLRKISEEDRHYIYINIDRVDKSIQDYALQKLDEVMAQKSDVPLAEFVQTLKYEGLSSAQKNYIKNLTEDEIKNWLMSVDDSRMIFYIKTLQTLSHYAFNGPGRHNPDSDTPINRALESLAKSSPLNEYRINNLIRSD